MKIELTIESLLYLVGANLVHLITISLNYFNLNILYMYSISVSCLTLSIFHLPFFFDSAEGRKYEDYWSRKNTDEIEAVSVPKY